MPSPKFRWQLVLQDEFGVTSIEYALLGALIAIVIVGAVSALGSRVQALYEFVAAEVVAAMP
ncbi:Flp family type IVb pilin [Cupriavidus sp. TMH.W2]|uniref:Flp family type IVb pilin n=1 Tax=Cupriavidus sp. TMH.W2 TaxID=3434465 RepID=UPI003D7822C8